jgi:hypothetical protein
MWHNPIYFFLGVWLIQIRISSLKEHTKLVLCLTHSNFRKVITACIYSVTRRSARLRIQVRDVHKFAMARRHWLDVLFGLWSTTLTTSNDYWTLANMDTSNFINFRGSFSSFNVVYITLKHFPLYCLNSVNNKYKLMNNIISVVLIWKDIN